MSRHPNLLIPGRNRPRSMPHALRDHDAPSTKGHTYRGSDGHQTPILSAWEFSTAFVRISPLTTNYSCLLRYRFRVACQWPSEPSKCHLVKGLILVSYPNPEANKAVRLSALAIYSLFDSLSAANPATSTTALGCCFRPILSCSPRLTKYLNNHLITLLSVGAPVFHHVMIMVRLTSPRIHQVEGYGLNLGFDGYELTSCHRQRVSLSPRAYPKILLRLF
jgi:hypothetical protein